MLKVFYVTSLEVISDMQAYMYQLCIKQFRRLIYLKDSPNKLFLPKQIERVRSQVQVSEMKFLLNKVHSSEIRKSFSSHYFTELKDLSLNGLAM